MVSFAFQKPGFSEKPGFFYFNSEGRASGDADIAVDMQRLSMPGRGARLDFQKANLQLCNTLPQPLILSLDW